MENEPQKRSTFIVRVFTDFIEWGNQWLTLSHWVFKKNDNIFAKVEALMLGVTAFTFLLLFVVQWMPRALDPLVIAFLFQRVLEFLIVYSRNFILKRGRVFTQFRSNESRGAWLILMFSVSLVQIIAVFAIGFHLMSLEDPNSFNKHMGVLDSFYFSMVTFLTVGYGDIRPLTAMPKLLIIAHGFLTYFVLVVVINGLTSNHFGDHKPQLNPDTDPQNSK